MKRYHAQKSPTVNGSEKEPVCVGEEKMLSQESLSAEIDEKEDKRADESNKETESHRPQESIRRSTCQDRRPPRFDDFVDVVVKSLLFFFFQVLSREGGLGLMDLMVSR